MRTARPRCEVRDDPNDPEVTCGRRHVAYASQPHTPEWPVCEEHARRAIRDGLDVVGHDGEVWDG